MRNQAHCGESLICSIIMEYADDGDLFQQIVKLSKENKMFYKEDEVWALLIQVTRALHHLHCLNIMH